MITPVFLVAVAGLLISNAMILAMFVLYHKKVIDDAQKQHLFLTDALVILHAKTATEAADAAVYVDQSRAQTKQHQEAFTEDLKKKASVPPVQNVGTGTILRTEDGRELEILS